MSGVTVKNKFNATTAPAVGNDSTEKYSPGSRWIDVTADKGYVCVDATEGAAVWKEITAAGGPGGEAFPVGSVFLSVVSTNPATLLGYGTWSAIAAGRVLVGLDSGDTDFDAEEETGGAKTVTLTTAQMPAHTHVQNAHNHAMTDLRGATTGGATTNFGGITASADTSSTVTAWVMPNATAVNQNEGGGGAHSNVQPYFVVRIWKRTA